MPKQSKTLVIKIHATTRKNRELERAFRTFIEKYKDKRGVYSIEVHEENVFALTPINLKQE